LRADLRVLAEALRAPILVSNASVIIIPRERMEGIMAGRPMPKVRGMRAITIVIAGALAALCCNAPANAQTTDQL
jgi:hypothetical protein